MNARETEATFTNAEIMLYGGIAVNGNTQEIQAYSQDMLGRKYKITCPCGVEVEHVFTEVPTENIPFPCGDPQHWLIKFYPKNAQSEL